MSKRNKFRIDKETGKTESHFSFWQEVENPNRQFEEDSEKNIFLDINHHSFFHSDYLVLNWIFDRGFMRVSGVYFIKLYTW